MDQIFNSENVFMLLRGGLMLVIVASAIGLAAAILNGAARAIWTSWRKPKEIMGFGRIEPKDPMTGA